MDCNGTTDFLIYQIYFEKKSKINKKTCRGAHYEEAWQVRTTNVINNF